MTYHVEEAKYPVARSFGWVARSRLIPKREAVGPGGAVNIDTGKVAWKYDTEQPLIGGGLATAGGLYFFGRATGTSTRWTRRPARKLWSFNCGARRQRDAGLLHGCREAAHRDGCGGNTQIGLQAWQQRVRVHG